MDAFPNVFFLLLKVTIGRAISVGAVVKIKEATPFLPALQFQSQMPSTKVVSHAEETSRQNIKIRAASGGVSCIRIMAQI